MIALSSSFIVLRQASVGRRRSAAAGGPGGDQTEQPGLCAVLVPGHWSGLAGAFAGVRQHEHGGDEALLDAGLLELVAVDLRPHDRLGHAIPVISLAMPVMLTIARPAGVRGRPVGRHRARRDRRRLLIALTGWVSSRTSAAPPRRALGAFGDTWTAASSTRSCMRVYLE